MKQKFDIFWNQHTKQNPGVTFTPEFKEIINACFYYDADERPSVNDLEQMPWMLQETPTQEEMQELLFQRFQ